MKGPLANLMKQAQQIQANMQKAQEELANMEVTGQAGGGMVVVPAGDYLTGTVHLKSRVTLWIQAGATLWGSTEAASHQPRVA